MALWKFGHFKVVSKLSKKLFKLGAWSVDYLIKFKKNLFIFPELWPIENSGVLNLSARYLENYLS